MFSVFSPFQCNAPLPFHSIHFKLIKIWLTGTLSPTGIHYLGQLHETSLLKVALDQITEGQLQFTRLEQHFDTLILGQPDERR